MAGVTHALADGCVGASRRKVALWPCAIAGVAGALAVAAVALAQEEAPASQDRDDAPAAEAVDAPAGGDGPASDDPMKEDAGATDAPGDNAAAGPAPDADAPPTPFALPDALPEGFAEDFDFEGALGVPGLALEQPSGPFGLPGVSLTDVLATLEPGPDAPVSQRLAWLFAELKIAPDADEAAFVAEEIEALWRDVGDPTASLLTDRAAAAAGSGDLGLARRLADGAVELAVQSAEAWVRSAEIATLDGDVLRAVTDLEQALRLEPRRYDALLTLGALFEQLENWAGAYDAYEAVLDIYPQHPYAQARAEDLEVRARGRAL